jgi:hypothetical protein
VLNAIYAFAFLAVAVVELAYLSSHGNAGLFGEQEAWKEVARLQVKK